MSSLQSCAQWLPKKDKDRRDLPFAMCSSLTIHFGLATMTCFGVRSRNNKCVFLDGDTGEMHMRSAASCNVDPRDLLYRESPDECPLNLFDGSVSRIIYIDARHTFETEQSFCAVDITMGRKVSTCTFKDKQSLKEWVIKETSIKKGKTVATVLLFYDLVVLEERFSPNMYPLLWGTSSLVVDLKKAIDRLGISKYSGKYRASTFTMENIDPLNHGGRSIYTTDAIHHRFMSTEDFVTQSISNGLACLHALLDHDIVDILYSLCVVCKRPWNQMMERLSVMYITSSALDVYEGYPDMTKKRKAKSQVVNDSVDKDDESHKGGLILASSKGIHVTAEANMYILDFKSMYPSIILETPEIANVMDHFLLKMVRDMNAKKNSSKGAFRFVFKLIANSVYGNIGNPLCVRVFNRAIAAMITRKGRESMGHCVEIAEAMGFTVLCGHTDSIFLYVPLVEGKDTDELVQDFIDNASDKTGGLVLEQELSFSKIFIMSKTSYCIPMTGTGERPCTRIKGCCDRVKDKRSLSKLWSEYSHTYGRRSWCRFFLKGTKTGGKLSSENQDILNTRAFYPWLFELFPRGQRDENRPIVSRFGELKPSLDQLCDALNRIIVEMMEDGCWYDITMWKRCFKLPAGCDAISTDVFCNYRAEHTDSLTMDKKPLQRVVYDSYVERGTVSCKELYRKEKGSCYRDRLWSPNDSFIDVVSHMSGLCALLMDPDKKTSNSRDIASHMAKRLGLSKNG